MPLVGDILGVAISCILLVVCNWVTVELFENVDVCGLLLVLESYVRKNSAAEAKSKFFRGDM